MSCFTIIYFWMKTISIVPYCMKCLYYIHKEQADIGLVLVSLPYSIIDLWTLFVHLGNILKLENCHNASFVSSWLALNLVTTYGNASYDKVGTIATLDFQWTNSILPVDTTVTDVTWASANTILTLQDTHSQELTPYPWLIINLKIDIDTAVWQCMPICMYIC